MQNLPKRKSKPNKKFANSILKPNNYNEAINSNQKIEWIHAMNEEMNSLIQNNTFQIIKQLPNNKKPISTKFIYKIKKNQSGEIEKFKARLVARGFTQK